MKQETAVASSITISITLGVYLLTLAPDLTWNHWGGDGGELITAAVTLGVPHPPGYPTYILLGKFISLLPIHPTALTFNLFSAICMTGAATFVTLIALHDPYLVLQPASHTESLVTERQHPLPAIATGLTLAFTPLVWSQAVITEVYGLNLLLLAAFLWALLLKRPSWLVGILLGLSFTTHLTSLLMLPLALGLTPWAQWRQVGLGLLLGCIPLLALPWLAQSNSPVIWGKPDTPSGWWWLVSGHLYHANLSLQPVSQLWTRAREWALLLLHQFTVAGPLLLLASLYQRTYPQPVNKRNAWLGITAVLYILYATSYHTVDAQVLLLPSLLLCTILLMPALYRLRTWALLLPVALLLLNFNQQTLHGNTNLRTRAEAALQEIPVNAVVLTPGNETIFALWYFQHVEGQRPDIILIDENLFAFDWYRMQLGQQYTDLHHLADDDLKGFVAANQINHPISPINLNKQAEDIPSTAR